MFLTLIGADRTISSFFLSLLLLSYFLFVRLFSLLCKIWNKEITQNQIEAFQRSHLLTRINKKQTQIRTHKRTMCSNRVPDLNFLGQCYNYLYDCDKNDTMLPPPTPRFNSSSSSSHRHYAARSFASRLAVCSLCLIGKFEFAPFFLMHQMD